MVEKYKLTDETKIVLGHTLHRIEYTADIPSWGIKAGSKGGWLESEENLSQDGECVVIGEGKVIGMARVRGNACVCCNAIVRDNAFICDEACISGDAQVLNCATVSGNAEVNHYSKVFGNAVITSFAIIDDTEDYFTINNACQHYDNITYTRSNDKWYDGISLMTTEEFIKQSYKISNNCGVLSEKIVKFVKSLYENDNDKKKQNVLFSILKRIFLVLTVPFMIVFTILCIVLVPIIVFVSCIMSFLITGSIEKIFDWKPFKRFVPYWGIQFSDDNNNFLCDYISLFNEDSDEK